MIARKKASEKMLLSDDTISQAIATEIDPRNGERLERLRLHNVQPNQRHGEWTKRREERLSKINNGRAIRTMMQSKHPRDWLWSDRGLKVGNKIRCIQALSSTLPIKINKTRGRTDMEEKKCRKCHLKIEDDQHILSTCEYNKKLIQERHNRLVDKIGKELKSKYLNGKIQLERSWQLGTELVKPDITTVDENGHCILIEVTCPYETSTEYLRQRKTEKEQKYRYLIKDELWQVGASTGEVIAIIIGAMGTILEDSHKSLKKIEIVEQCNALQMTAMNSSVIAMNTLPETFTREPIDEKSLTLIKMSQASRSNWTVSQRT